jgi:hypothetical protein
MTLGDLSDAYSSYSIHRACMGGCIYSSSHYMHKAKDIDPQSTKGVGFTGCKVTVWQVNWVGSWRWPCGHVALRAVISWALI